MKRVLVLGPHSYIGGQFRQYLAGFPGEYETAALSVRTDAWREADFSRYDSVLYAAGIAHRRERKEDAPLYERVNCALAVETAQKARAAGVKRYIYLSSASVYGLTEGVIRRDTPPAPKSLYGRSKLRAERALEALHSPGFQVILVRPPMVYGPGCPGNYRALEKLAAVLPVFADWPNRRSVISADNLSRFLRELADGGEGGIYFPQDPEYGCTSRMVRELAAARGRELPLARWLNPLVALLRLTPKGRKAFGTLIYEGEPLIERFPQET